MKLQKVHEIVNKQLTAIVCAVFAIFASVDAKADTLWVDDDNYGKAGLTGATKELAYGTIQDAVDAASAGDTIRVLPGVYTNGSSAASLANTTPARVAVKGSTKNNLTIIADGKAEETIIRGAYATAATDISTACGDGAIGCVLVKDVTSFRLEGFTLEGGATLQGGGDARQCYGGAFNGYDVNGAGQICLVRCTIRECAAGWGVVFGATCVRCSITECFSNNGSSTSGLIRQSWLYNCILAHNRGYDIIGVSTYAINTTFGDNKASRRLCRNNCYLYNCVVAASGSVTDGVIEKDCCVTDGYPVMSTATDDWHLRRGGGAETAGTAANLMKFDVPSDCRYIDFFGKPIPQDGAIAAGASQEVDTPAGGCIEWKTVPWTIDGKVRYAGTYVFPSIYPTQYLAKANLDSGKYLMRYKFGSTWIPAEMDDSCWMMPSPSTGQVDAVVFEQTSTVLWVDKATGNDTTATGTEALPYRTLQAAVSSAVSGTRIHVKKGVYDEGGGYDQGCSNRVQIGSKTLRIIGVDGASETVIKGEKDASTLGASSMPGCGDAAMRCVFASSGGQIQGFTLSGGRTAGPSGTTEGQRGGGVWKAGNQAYYVTDCVISDCRGGPWGAVRAAFVCRSRITDCHGTTSVFSSDVMTALVCCEIGPDNGCDDGADLGVVCCDSYHCSIAGTDSMWPYPAEDSRTHVGDAVMKGCQINDGGTFAGCVFGEILHNNASAGFVPADPRFVDPASLDLRVLANSQVFTAGEIPTDENYGANYYLRAMTSDIDGNRLVFNGGKPVAGAHHVGVQGLWIGAAKGGLAITGAQAGANLAETIEGTVTVGPSWNATKPCIGFTVCGVTNLFDEMTGVYSISAADFAAGVDDVETIYTSDWYVDAVNGVDDAAHVGFTPKTAKNSLEAVMALPSSGDKVHALPGIYAGGTMLQVVNGDTIRARVVVPEGVSLVADGGPAVTAIEGASATVDAADNGCGANAVRCVQLMQHANVSGFTLRGGRVAAGTSNSRDYSGAGVMGYNYANATYSTVENCVISNCVAGFGAAGRYATFVKCLVTDNAKYSYYGDGSSGTSDSAQYGCLFDRNNGRVLVYGEIAIVNCTLAAGNKADYFIGAANVSDCIKNSLVYGTIMEHERLNVYRTYVAGTIPDAQLKDGSLKVSADDVVLDEYGRPVIGENIGIDMANPEYLQPDLLGGTDLLGCQRVYNGALDIGAVEADWRPRYGKVLGRRVEVVRATPAVIETAGPMVRVPSGALLDASVDGGAAAGAVWTVSFVVNPGSAVAVTVNGEEHLYDSPGANTLEFSSVAGMNTVAFACVAGSVDVGEIKKSVGTMIIVL